MIQKYWKWFGGVAAVVALLTSFVFNVDKLFTKGFTAWEDRSITEQIYEFERTHIILGDEQTEEGETIITYRTCYAPEVPYTLSFIVNGRNVFSVDVDPSVHGSVFTQHCETFTGRPLPFELKDGDKLTVKYNFKGYNSFETIYLKK